MTTEFVLDVKDKDFNGIRIATYRCPSKTCLKDHIIAMCDARFLNDIPGFREAWFGFLKQAAVAIGQKIVEDAGGTVDHISVDEVKNLN